MARFCQSRQFRALSRPLTLSWPCRSWFACSIVEISVFLRNFSEPVEPAELPPNHTHTPPPGFCRSRPSGLARGLQVSFWSSDERFLDQSPLFLLALASTGLTGVLHVLYQVPHSSVERGLSFPFVPVFVVKALNLLCSSVCRLHCTGHPNASTIALGNCQVQ